eukprot:7041896-Prymnesium_polylepis.2
MRACVRTGAGPERGSCGGSRARRLRAGATGVPPAVRDHDPGTNPVRPRDVRRTSPCRRVPACATACVWVGRRARAGPRAGVRPGAGEENENHVAPAAKRTKTMWR